MTKKVTIVEEDVQEFEPEETREDILQAINTPEPAPPSSPVQQPVKQRVNNLVQCELCNKFVTKKTLNYSHAKTCKGNPENQVKQKKHQNHFERHHQNQFERHHQNQSNNLFLHNTGPLNTFGQPTSN